MPVVAVLALDFAVLAERLDIEWPLTPSPRRPSHVVVDVVVGVRMKEKIAISPMLHGVRNDFVVTFDGDEDRPATRWERGSGVGGRWRVVGRSAGE